MISRHLIPSFILGVKTEVFYLNCEAHTMQLQKQKFANIEL